MPPSQSVSFLPGNEHFQTMKSTVPASQQHSQIAMGDLVKKTISNFSSGPDRGQLHATHFKAEPAASSPSDAVCGRATKPKGWSAGTTKFQ